MSHRYLFLSYPLSINTPTPPAIPKVETEPFLSISKDGANVTMLKLTSHTGTHLDVPSHVIPEAMTLTEFTAKDFIFDLPMVVNLPMQEMYVVEPSDLAQFLPEAKNADFLLFRFGYGRIRATDPLRFTTKSPGFGIESAKFIVENFPNLRGIGMDVPSFSCIEYLNETMYAHNIFFQDQKKKIIVEDMNLEENLDDLSRLIIVPLIIQDIDGAPCTIIGEIVN